VVRGASGSGTASFVDTWQLGVYRADPISAGDAAAASPAPAGQADTTTSWFAVDLFEPGESSIAPGDGRALAALGGSPGTAATAGVARDEWWLPLVLLLLVALLAEWLLYERDGARRITHAIRSRLGRPGVRGATR
jgi:hypothetical protein